MDEINEKTASQVGDLMKALDRLEEALNEEKDDFIRDSVIQRFEFCFELCWKLVKNYNAAQGKETFTPKDSFRVGAQGRLIDQPEVWFEYLKARNLASHTYNEATSEKVYQAAKNFLTDGRNLLVRIQSQSGLFQESENPGRQARDEALPADAAGARAKRRNHAA